MSRVPRLLLVVVLLATSAGLSACSSGPSTGDKGYVDGAGLITRLPVAERERVEAVDGTTLEGNRLDLSSYAGKVVVLNVWGSWCGPCREEAPGLAAAARALAADDVVFVGVNTKDSSTDNALAFQRRFDVPYPSLYDPSGRTLLAFRDTLPPNAIPSTLVIDRQGRVAASILGKIPTQRTLVDLVQDVDS